MMRPQLRDELVVALAILLVERRRGITGRGRRRASLRCALDVTRKVLDLDATCARQHHGACKALLELAHIPWPCMKEQGPRCLGGEGDVRRAVAGMPAQECRREQSDVFSPIAQRR